MTRYIGIDVSKDTLSVFDGKRDIIFKNEKGLKEVKKYLNKYFKSTSSTNGSKFNDVVIIFEATGVYSSYLKNFCSANKIKVFMVNPKRSSGLSKVLGNRSKTDEIDAKMLYAFKNIIKDDEVKILKDKSKIKILFQYLSSYELIVKTRVSVSNHIKSLEYIEDSSNNNINNINANNANNVSKSASNILKELKIINEKEKELEERILCKAEEYIENEKELKGNYHNLLSIPGIGKIAAIALLYFFANYENTNRSQITALLGLDPTKKESGKSIKGRRKISKSGNALIRKILYFPTMNTIQHNEKIKAFYNRLLENHKTKKVALIACMKKLLLIAHSIYINKTTFEYSR